MREMFVSEGYVYIKQKIDRATVTAPAFPVRRILAEVDKESITASGTEFATVTFKVQEFSIGVEDYVDFVEDPIEIIVDVAGTRGCVIAENGIAVIEFDADYPGEYVIKTDVPLAGNAEVKVVAV